MSPMSEQDSTNSLQDILTPYAEQEIDTTKEIEQEVNDAIDDVNQLQSSGDDTPMSQLDRLLETIGNMKLPEAEINELEKDATNMVGFTDGEILKDKIKRLQSLK